MGVGPYSRYEIEQFNHVEEINKTLKAINQNLIRIADALEKIELHDEPLD